MADVFLDTYKLDIYAQRLGNIIQRIYNLEYRVDTLYRNTGLVGLWNISVNNHLSGYNWRLIRCQTYLQQTSSDFSSIENVLKQINPETFSQFSGPQFAEHMASLDIDENERSLFAKFVNNEIKGEKSLISGSKSKSGKFLGVDAAAKASGSILYGSAGVENSMSWGFDKESGKWDFKEFGGVIEAKASGAIAKGEVEGKYGIVSGKLGGEFLTGAVGAELSCALWNDGEFRPSLSLGASAEASVLSGEGELVIGSDQYGAFGKASGNLLHAEAEAGVGAGYLGEDDDGNALYGVEAKASAMACVAQGEVEGGFTIFGIDIGIGLKGQALAVGVEAGGTLTTEGVTASFSGALGLGAGLDISIDWSDAKWIGDTVDAVGTFFSDAGDGISDFIDDAGETLDDFIDDAQNVFSDVTDYLFDWF